MPKVNPQILVFAREAAGLSVEEAAKKLSLSAPERLLELEEGERDPSRRVLVNMSKKYHRPLLTFYLPSPPRESDKGRDFRTLPDGELLAPDGLVDALLRNVSARQGLVRAALEDADEDIPLPFVGSASTKEGVEVIVNSMRRVLQFSLEDFRSQNSVDSAFSALRNAAENAGIFVLLMGNLGNYHTDIDVRLFRGFALADEVAPFVVINEKDSRAAWSFTLLHELAHIWLGQTGISGYDGEEQIERFCDEVAARFLLSPAELAEINMHEIEDFDVLKYRIETFAAERKVSRKMVSYNLLRSGQISRKVYRELSNVFDEERMAQREIGKTKKSTPDYYVVRRHRVGPGLVGMVRRMVAGGILTTTKAGRVLGVKPTAVSRLINGNKAA